MSRLKESTILFSSPMVWLEKLFINFHAHLSSGRCDSLLSCRSLSCAFWTGSPVIIFSTIMCFSLFVTNKISVITLRICAFWQICQWYSTHWDYFRLAAMRCCFPFANTMGFHDYDNWNTFICIWVLSLLKIKNPIFSASPITSYVSIIYWNNYDTILSHPF